MHSAEETATRGSTLRRGVNPGPAGKTARTIIPVAAAQAVTLPPPQSLRADTPPAVRIVGCRVLDDLHMVAPASSPLLQR